MKAESSELCCLPGESKPVPHSHGVAQGERVGNRGLLPLQKDPVPGQQLPPHRQGKRSLGGSASPCYFLLVSFEVSWPLLLPTGPRAQCSPVKVIYDHEVRLLQEASFLDCLLTYDGPARCGSQQSLTLTYALGGDRPFCTASVGGMSPLRCCRGLLMTWRRGTSVEELAPQIDLWACLGGIF